MESSLRGLIDRIFAAMQAKNLDNVMSQFADDAVLIDPHFPHPRMEGKAVIAEGLQRAMTQMQSFGYTTMNYFESKGGQRAAVEVATHHVAMHGKKLNFPQVFVFEAGEGRITRMQAYEPYGPHGLFGVFLFLARHLKKRPGK
jgi:ketosteroid isomerase-like protein